MSFLFCLNSFKEDFCLILNLHKKRKKTIFFRTCFVQNRLFEDIKNLFFSDAEVEGKFNVAFLSNMLTGNLPSCLKLLLAANRLPEAAMFCRTYLPSEAPRVTQMWKGILFIVLNQCL